MKEKKRRGATNLTDRSPHQEQYETQLPHSKSNRLKKQRKLIEMNPGFIFYFDERGICCYRKKRVK